MSPQNFRPNNTIYTLMAGYFQVSIITACYKKGKYLPVFLEELPNQTYFSNLEVVFDHNEPSDQEIELLNNFQNKYPNQIKHIITNPAEPLGVSWNRCIRESTGEYLAIWNIDDLRTKKSIEIQAQFLNNNPSIDIVSGNFFIVPAFPSIRGKFIDEAKYPPEEMVKSMKLGPFFMFRKKLCEKAGYFDEQFRCANDFDLAMRLLHHGKARILRENLGFFLNEAAGASTKPSSLCPVEKTVIELRYGIYDRIDYRLVPQALKYNIYNIRMGNRWIPVGDYIPDYETWLLDRFDKFSTTRFFVQFGTNVYRKLKKLIFTK